MRKTITKKVIIALSMLFLCCSLFAVSYQTGRTLIVYPDSQPWNTDIYIQFDPYNKTASLVGFNTATEINVVGDKTGKTTKSINSGNIDYTFFVYLFTSNSTLSFDLLSEKNVIAKVEFQNIEHHVINDKLDKVRTLYENTLKVFQLEQQYYRIAQGEGLSNTELASLETELKSLISDSQYPSVKATYLLGLFYYKQGYYSKALEAFSKISGLNSNIYLAELAYVNSAICNEQMGLDSAAIENYRTLLSRYGQESAVSPKALFNLGRIYAKSPLSQKDAFTVLKVLSETYEDSEYGKLAYSWVSSAVNTGFSPLLYKELTGWLSAPDYSKTTAIPNDAWGMYNGKSIKLEYNNVFYNTVVNDSNLQSAYFSGDFNTLYSIYYNAYQAQVVFIALSEEAQKAGIIAPQELVNDLILRAGPYNGPDGSFSSEVFLSKTEREKLSVNAFYTDYFPYSVVLQDLQTAIVPEQETSFVSEISRQTRSFDYFAIDYNAYPDNLAASYGKSSGGLFDQLPLSIISTKKEEDINSAYEALKYGASWEETVEAYSEDSSASDGGVVGNLHIFSIMTNLVNNKDIEKIKTMKVGSYTAPIQGPNGYTIYRLNSAKKVADFNDRDTLSAVKYYLYTHDISTIAPYIDTSVEDATALAQTNFRLASEKYNAEIVSVKDVSNNIGESQYLPSIKNNDSLGYLAEAAKNESNSHDLFTTEKGGILGISSENVDEDFHLIVKIVDVQTNNTTASYVTSMLYSNYAPQQPAYDKMQIILSSSKHIDNFYTQFFSVLFGGL